MKQHRHAFLVLSAALGLSGAAIAADDHSGHMSHAAPASAQANVLWADGTVKKLDKAGAKVTIAHGPLDNLGMPPMTMVFRVKDAAWLNQMKEGDRIRFVADYVKGSVTVVRYEPAR